MLDRSAEASLGHLQGPECESLDVSINIHTEITGILHDESIYSGAELFFFLNKLMSLCAILQK